jgi:hypothetical protein
VHVVGGGAAWQYHETQLNPAAHSHEALQRARHAPLTQSSAMGHSWFAVQVEALVPPLLEVAPEAPADDVPAVAPLPPALSAPPELVPPVLLVPPVPLPPLPLGPS